MKTLHTPIFNVVLLTACLMVTMPSLHAMHEDQRDVETLSLEELRAGAQAFQEQAEQTQARIDENDVRLNRLEEQVNELILRARVMAELANREEAARPRTIQQHIHIQKHFFCRQKATIPRKR